VPSFEAETILLLKMCCHFIQWNIGPDFCVIFFGIYVQFSWLRHYATSWKVAGSIPSGVTGIFH